MPWLPLAIVGSSLVGAGASLWGAKKQSDAAAAQSRYQAKAGKVGSRLIDESRNRARGDLGFGAQGATDKLEAARNTLYGGKQEVRDVFAQERQAGSDALAKLQALMGGDMSAFTADPGYQFRLAEGNKALQRAASASGTFGSGANLKDFSAFGQNLASNEYQNVVNRLMGIAGIGSDANRSYAGLATGLTQGMAGYQGQQAGTLERLGQSLAQTEMNAGTGRANALLGAASGASQYAMDQANAQAGGANAVGQALTQGMLAAALFGGGAGSPSADPSGRSASLGSAPASATYQGLGYGRPGYDYGVS